MNMASKSDNCAKLLTCRTQQQIVAHDAMLIIFFGVRVIEKVIAGNAQWDPVACFY